MPRENSFSDSEGRSLTPDLEDESRAPRPRSPILPVRRLKSPVTSHRTKSVKSSKPTGTVDVQSTLSPIERFRMSVRKVMHINRTSSCFSGKGPGAEPGVDVRRDSAYLSYGHIRQNCLIEIADYSGVRSSFGRMTNVEFINFLNNPKASKRDPWVKVRWINVGGISWDVIRALALKYGMAGLRPFVMRPHLTQLCVRTPPSVSRGCTPHQPSFRRRLLQEASLYSCPQPHPQPRRPDRTTLPRADRPLVFPRTPETFGSD